ncbi:putative 26S proteasome non-ATPase regulatory subunit 9 [Myxozyma melibiosi]|uniref:26S proteasome non-ATPase regulatory subunit 9 n=1 Tax=Myxozyma melibiosi TaxID=54550 RepID=A0ABR1F4U1_9ASCO
MENHTGNSGEDRRQNIHDPSVARVRFPQTSLASSSSSSRLEELMRQRRALEDELDSLIQVLESHHVDMSTPLLTSDGFPRDDIDVAQVRITRTRVIRLRNDLKRLMLQMEEVLHEHHASIREAMSSGGLASGMLLNRGGGVGNGAGAEVDGVAFAVVNSVEDRSPAHEAGLLRGDKIVKFGDVNAENHQHLSRLSTVVQQNQGRPIEISLIRDIGGAQARAQINIQLTPRSGWGGRGTLGCHIIPL